MKTIGVTGGAGFIGSYVTEELIERGFRVVTFDRTAPGILRDIPVGGSIEFFQGDIRDSTAVTEFAAHVDGIIHLAAVLGTQETIKNPRPSVETNVLGGINVFEAAVQYGLPVVYAGVGNHWMRTHGGGSYTITKTVIEDFAQMYVDHRDAAITVVRPVNAYGPRQSVAAPYGSSKVRKIIPSFVARAINGDDIEVYGDGSQISDCVHVADVARTFVDALVLTDGVGPLPTIEIGPEASVTVQQIAESIRDIAESYTGNRSKIINLPMRPGEVPNATVSADKKTREVLGRTHSERPLIDLSQGLEETVRYYIDAGYQR